MHTGRGIRRLRATLSCQRPWSTKQRGFSSILAVAVLLVWVVLSPDVDAALRRNQSAVGVASMNTPFHWTAADTGDEGGGGDWATGPIPILNNNEVPDLPTPSSLGSCSAEELSAARSTLSGWCAASRNHYVPPNCEAATTSYDAAALAGSGKSSCDRYTWHGRPMFATVWEGGQLPCTDVKHGAPASARDFVVTVVAMDVSLGRAAAVADTWAKAARTLGATVEFVAVEGDAASPGGASAAGVIRATAPLVELSLGGGERALLPLLALKHAATRHPGARWHVLVTDETWVSLEEAVAAVRFWEPRMPLLVGHIDTGILSKEVGGKLGPFATRPADAAGVIISAAGAAALADAVLSAACPWPTGSLAQSWGLALGRCAWIACVPQMHSQLMWPGMDNLAGKSWHFDRNDAVLESLISIAPGGFYKYMRSDGTDGQNDTMHTIQQGLRLKYNGTAFSALNGRRRRLR